VYLKQNDPDVIRLTHEIMRTDPIYFNSEWARSVISQYVKDGDTLLYSNEALSSPSWAGLMSPGMDVRSHALVNLKSVFVNPKIAMIIRRQDTFSSSLYRQYLKSGGTKKITELFGCKNYTGVSLLPRNYFNYLRYIEALHEYFSGNVMVLPFELMKHDPNLFLEKLASYIDVECPRPTLLGNTNSTKLGDFGFEFTRRLNYLFRSNLNPGGLIPGIPRKGRTGIVNVSPVTILHEKWPFHGVLSETGSVKQCCRELLYENIDSNKGLDTRYGLGLKEYGYY
jgi:hypothetical protein